MMSPQLKLKIYIKRYEKSLRTKFRRPLIKRFLIAVWMELWAYYRRQYMKFGTRRLQRGNRRHFRNSRNSVGGFVKRESRHLFLLTTLGAFSRRGFAFHSHKGREGKGVKFSR